MDERDKGYRKKIKDLVAKESAKGNCCDSRNTQINEIEEKRAYVFWEMIRGPFVTLSQEIETEVQQQIDRLINNFCDRYERQFNGELQKRQEFMENLEGDKRTNEELGDEISSLKAEKKLSRTTSKSVRKSQENCDETHPR